MQKLICVKCEKKTNMRNGEGLCLACITDEFNKENELKSSQILSHEVPKDIVFETEISSMNVKGRNYVRKIIEIPKPIRPFIQVREKGFGEKIKYICILKRMKKK